MYYFILTLGCKKCNINDFPKELFIHWFFNSTFAILLDLTLSDLLEKSRAVHQAPDERIFHIFYQMLNGMDAKQKTDFLLEDPKSYKFLSNGNLPVPGVNDSAEFEDTVEAMNIMGMPEDEQSGVYMCVCVHVTYLTTLYPLIGILSLMCMLFQNPACFRVVSAVLHFGNMQFKQERNSDQAILPDNTVAQKIAKLLGMAVTDFTKALLKPKIKTGREFTVRSQNKAQVSKYM